MCEHDYPFHFKVYENYLCEVVFYVVEGRNIFAVTQLRRNIEIVKPCMSAPPKLLSKVDISAA